MTDESERSGRPEHGIPAPRFRLPPGTHPGKVRLQVSDLDRSLTYYRRVLGVRTLERAGARASLGAEDDGPPLVDLRERRGAAPAPPHGRLGLYHYALLLPGRGDLGRFARHLGELGERHAASDHLVSEAIYLRDPDGLGIEVYADRPRADWRWRDGELRMTTEPLDRASLIRAAGTDPWSGMPPGTTLGHVHLHVGDLDEAARLYHEALGLDRVVWSYPGALFLSAGGYHHHLGLNTWAGSAPPAAPDEARLRSWTLVLPDETAVERALESVEAAGYSAARTDGRHLVEDPWGTVVELMSAGGPAG